MAIRSGFPSRLDSRLKLLMAAASAVPLVATGAARAHVPPTGNWSLLFGDEFNPTAAGTLDRDKWGYAYPWSQHGLADDSVEVPSAVSVANGSLAFTATNTGQWYNNAWYNYSSGAVNTNGLTNFTGGYIEASQKMASQQGTWPAFWMLQGGWPPEIDIEEVPSFSANATTYNTAYHYSAVGTGTTSSAGPGLVNENTNLSAGYNTYGVDWESNSLSFYFNGSYVGQVTGSQANIAQAAGMYLLLDMGVGGWPGEPASNSINSSSPAVMQTDWVRVWQNSGVAQTNWTSTGSGNWDDGSRWNSGVPTLTSTVAYFGATGGSGTTVSWTGSRSVNGLVLDSPTKYTIGGVAGVYSTTIDSGTGVAWGYSGEPALMISGADGVPSAAETVAITQTANATAGNIINARIEVPYSLLTLDVNNASAQPIVFNGDLIGTGAITFNSGSVVLNGNDQTAGWHTFQNGAAVTLNGQISASAEFTIAAGTVQANSNSTIVANQWLSVGSTTGGIGVLNLSGGSVTAKSDFNIGDVTGSNGTIVMTGGSIAAANFYLGKTGTAVGLLVQSGGSIAGTSGSGGDWRIGGAASTSDSTAVGTYNLSSGTFSAPGNFQVGAYGHGTVNQTGGTVNVNNYLSIGRFGGGVGLWNISGGTINASNVSALIVGEQGTGTLLVGGSATVNAKQLSIANTDGTSATGTVTQTGGTINAGSGVVFGSGAAGTATSTGVYTLSAGVLETPFVSQAAGSGVVGTFNFNGGTIKPLAVSPSLFQGVSNLHVQAGGAVISASGIHLTLGQSLTHDPAMGATPDGGLVKTGYNTLTINAAQSYTGATNVSAGTLQLSAAPSIPALGEVADLDASTLSLANGAAVTYLADSSVLKNNAAVTVAGDNPTFNTNSLNGKGTINFNGSSQGLTTAGLTGITGNSARTIFVIDERATGGAVTTHLGTTVASQDYGISDENGKLFMPYSYVNDITTTAETAGTWRLFAAVHNPAATTADTGYVNGVQTTTGNLTLNTTNSPLQLGYRSGDGLQNSGNIAEVIVYNVALTAAQIQTVDQYLDYKWFGTALPTVSNLLPVGGTVNISAIGATLDLNGVNQTVGALNGVSGSLVTLGAATLTINNTGTDTYLGNIIGTGGLNKSSAGLLILGGTNTYSGPTNIMAGSLTIPAGASLGGSSVVVNSGATLYVAGSLSPGTTITDNGNLSFPANTTALTVTHSLGTLSIGTGMTVNIAAEANHAGRQVLLAGAINVGPNGTLNLTNNDLDLSSASLQSVTNLAGTGYNLSGGANWSGRGITSATAAADTSHLTALGVIQNNQDGSPIYTGGNPFDGTTPGAGDVLVKYTYFGDANLDGTIDGSDYSLIDGGFASNGTLTGWLNGDFNYDGVIDGSDYALLDNSFNNQSTSFAAGGTALVAEDTAEVAGAPAATVPEPAGLAVFGLTSAALLALRRRSSRQSPGLFSQPAMVTVTGCGRRDRPI